MPAVDGPEGLPGSSWSPSFEKRVPPQSGTTTRCAWMRPVGDLGSGGTTACALAYMSDDLPARAAVALSGRERIAPETHDDWVPEGVVSSSLEHSMWFFDVPGADGWHLFTAEAVALVHSRCLVRGEVFDRDGRIVASVSQLVRVEWEEGS